MTELHVVTGAGPVGWTVAEQLAAQGHSVRVLTRSGSGPDHPMIERRAVDIESDDLRPHLSGATAIYHCTHAAYENTVWRDKLEAMEKRVLDAAAGTIVAFPESLYAYGRVDGPIRENTPATPPTASWVCVRSSWRLARSTRLPLSASLPRTSTGLAS